MTQIARNTSKGQLQRYTFVQEAAAASQSAVALRILETDDGTTQSILGVTEHVIPFDFDVVAIAVRADAARTGGTLTVDATINGTVTGLTAVLDATNTQSASSRQPRESDRGVRNDRIGVKVTTVAGWTPVTADILVDVYAIVFLDGI